MAAETGHVPTFAYKDRSGNLHLNGASLFDASENDCKSVVSGVADGYKVARGEVALDGANPTPVTTGLTTIVAAVVSLKGTAAPGDNTSVLTYDTTGGTLNIYAWKNTGGTDPTLVASTGTETVGWVAVGT